MDAYHTFIKYLDNQEKKKIKPSPPFPTVEYSIKKQGDNINNNNHIVINNPPAKYKHNYQQPLSFHEYVSLKNNDDNKTKSKKSSIDMSLLNKQISFNFCDIEDAIEVSGRKADTKFRNGEIDDTDNYVNRGKMLSDKAPEIVKESKHRFALLLGGDCNKNLGKACNRDLLAMWNEVLDPVYGIDIENVLITTQVDETINKVFKGASIREMTPSNFEATVKELLGRVAKTTTNEKVFIYIHYSGHGYRVPNKKQFKKGDVDEAILVGPRVLLTGYEIRDNFLALFKSNVHIFSLWDACHSGSIADLPYKWVNNVWVENTINESMRRKIKAKIISISACEDSQVDAQIVGKILGYGGALTIFFYENGLYYSIDNPKVVLAGVDRSMKKIRQIPVLTSSWKF